MSDRPSRIPPDECAQCGATLKRSALACADCGADERTGWRESPDSLYDGLDLPDAAYTDDDPPAPVPRRSGVPWYWLVVAASLIALLIGGMVLSH